MAASVETPSPTHLNKESTSFSVGSSPLFSPSSDKRFWSTLRSRVDMLLEDQSSKIPTGQCPISDSSMPTQTLGKSERAKRLKEDSLLLIRGFDSIAHTLSQLSNNLESALQGATDLAKQPTLTEIFQSGLNNSEKEEQSGKQENNEAEPNIGLKRKFDSSHCLDDPEDESKNKDEQDPKDGKMKKAKNLAVSMAAKATALARELKSIKSGLSFTQERCALLEEENRWLRDGFAKGIRPEEDDLVRLQLEVLLAEKSRLANENANLIRENQCLHQLVEYHQLTNSQDLSSPSYEQVIQGMCLDFSSPPPLPYIVEDDATDEPHDVEDDATDEPHDVADGELPQSPKTRPFGNLSKLNECSQEE